MRSLIVGRVGADLGAAIVLLLFCAWAYYVTTTFDPPVLRGFPGAAFFPQLILLVLLLLALLLLGRSVMARSAMPRAGDGAGAGEYHFEIGPFLLIVGAVFLLIAGIRMVGFEIATVLFLTVLLGLRSGRWLQALLVGLVSTGVMYLLFVQLLRVHLPLMLLPRYL